MTTKEITLEDVIEFYDFLQGELPKGMTIPKAEIPKLNSKKAFNVIWYLQEHLRVLPDHYEQCDNCDSLFDDYSEGFYHDYENCDCVTCHEDKTAKRKLRGKHFCSDSCENSFLWT